MHQEKVLLLSSVFILFFRSSDSNAADVCFVVPLRTALRAITCDIYKN